MPYEKEPELNRVDTPYPIEFLTGIPQIIFWARNLIFENFFGEKFKVYLFSFWRESYPETQSESARNTSTLTHKFPQAQHSKLCTYYVPTQWLIGTTPEACPNQHATSPSHAHYILYHIYLILYRII